MTDENLLVCLSFTVFHDEKYVQRLRDLPGVEPLVLPIDPDGSWNGFDSGIPQPEPPPWATSVAAERRAVLDRAQVLVALHSSEDLLAEMPYSDPPKRFESLAEYKSFVEPALEMLKFTLSLERVHSCTDPSMLIAEYTSDGIAIPTGKPYRNVYIGIWRFREQRICGIREFFNPALTAEALTPD